MVRGHAEEPGFHFAHRVPTRRGQRLGRLVRYHGGDAAHRADAKPHPNLGQRRSARQQQDAVGNSWSARALSALARLDRKSTRLNSSHEWISYAVFCLKKKKNKT